MQWDIRRNGDSAGSVGGAVAAAVIGDNDFAGDVLLGEERRGGLDVAGDFVGFVVGGDNDRKLECGDTGRCGRGIRKRVERVGGSRHGMDSSRPEAGC